MSIQFGCLPTWDKNQVLPAHARLFIGLWPKSSSVSAIKPQALQLSHRIQGRALAPQYWHITLAYMGQSAVEQWQHLLQQVPTWNKLAVPLELKLDRLDYFSAAQVLWLGMDPRSSAYHQLQMAHQQLWQWLSKLGWQREDRDFVPHVSLLRQAQLQGVSFEPISTICWQTLALKLIVSLPHSERSEYYQVLDLPISL